jgi:hypothetical protein
MDGMIAVAKRPVVSCDTVQAAARMHLLHRPRTYEVFHYVDSARAVCTQVPANRCLNVIARHHVALSASGPYFGTFELTDYVYKLIQIIAIPRYTVSFRIQ